MYFHWSLVKKNLGSKKGEGTYKMGIYYHFFETEFYSLHNVEKSLIQYLSEWWISVTLTFDNIQTIGNN